MSGTAGPDEAARLEVALDRIARAARRPPPAALHSAPPLATTPAEAAPSSEVAARLDALIADLRAVLGTQG
ncbi:MAG: hypothetical protein WDN04_15815 [Rhodospirillales bacterium]